MSHTYPGADAGKRNSAKTSWRSAAHRQCDHPCKNQVGARVQVCRLLSNTFRESALVNDAGSQSWITNSLRDGSTHKHGATAIAVHTGSGSEKHIQWCQGHACTGWLELLHAHHQALGQLQSLSAPKLCSHSCSCGRLRTARRQVSMSLSRAVSCCAAGSVHAAASTACYQPGHCWCELAAGLRWRGRRPAKAIRKYHL